MDCIRSGPERQLRPYSARHITSIVARAFALAAIALLTLQFAGCGYAKMSFRKAHAKRWNSLRAQKAAYPERNHIITGKIEDDALMANAPLAVIAVSDDIRQDEVVDMSMMNSPSYYFLYLPPGTYTLVAFADINGDKRFRTDEMVGMYDGNGRLLLEGDSGGVRSDINITVDLSSPSTAPFRINKRVRNLNNIDIRSITTSLDNPLFTEKMGGLGLYDPANFMRRSPSLLYTLEGDISRTPVVFVHGIKGTPANFTHIAAALDRSRFHPWFLFYPTGESLDKSAELLHMILDEMLPFEDIVIVAHSMGGLVSRAAIVKYSQSRRSDYIRAYISLSSPYGGVEAARAASMSDVSAPSWLDLPPSSDFITHTMKEPIPEHVKFHMLFAYGDEDLGNQCSDGAVSVRSQLHQHTQSQADSMYGFELDHRQMLTHPLVIGRINTILEELDLSDDQADE